MRQALEPEGVGFLAVSIEPRKKLVQRGVAEIGIRMRVAISEDELLAPLGVKRVPSTVFVNAEGVVVAAASGERSRAFFEKRARALLLR